MKRKSSYLWTGIVGSVLVCCVLVLGCARILPELPEEKLPADTLFLSSISDPKTFNEILAKETSSTDAIAFLFEGLVTTDGVTQEIKPNLASSWTTSADGKRWTFYLREDVRWFDGRPFTAADVIFTFNDLIYNDKIPGVSARSIFTIAGKRIKFEQVGPYVVVCELPEVFAPFLRSMSQPILPKHILYPAVAAGKFTQVWGVNTPPKQLIGLGPYKMVEYIPGERIVYERNPNYYKCKVKIPRLVRYIVENQDIQVVQFEANELDVLGFSGKDYARLTQLKKKMKNFTIYDCGPNFGSEFIVFNQNECFVDKEKVCWFRDLSFRKAVAHAIDKHSIIQNVYYQKAYPQDSAMSAAAKTYFTDDVQKYPYNPPLAKEILKNAGYEDRDGDGIIEDKWGVPVEFTLLTNSGNVARERLGQMIAEDLRKLGMKVHFSPIDFNALVERLSNTGRWESVLIGLTGGIEPHFGKNVWEIEGPLHLWNMKPLQKELHDKWRKSLQPWEYEIDKIFQQAATTLDENLRKQLYHRWQRIVSENLPLIYTVNPSALYAIRDRVKGVKPTAYGGALHNLEELYLTP